MDYKYKDLFLQDSIKKELYISFDNGLITNSELHSNQFELSESICSDSELRFGGCEASELRFKVSNIYNSLKNKTIDVSMVLDDNEDEPFAFGRYTVYSDTPTADRSFRDIVAYDKMYDIVNANVADWYNSLQFPMTLKEFRTAFVSNFGINEVDIELVNDDMIVEKTIEAIELSGGDVARAICEINGCFGHINRNNEFEYIVLLGNTELLPSNDLYPSNELLPYGSNYSKTVSKSHYISCQYEDFVTKEIDGIEVRPEEESAGAIVGNSKGNVYTIFGNFLLYEKTTEQLETIANNLMPLVNNVYYRPCNIVAIGDPTIRVGDGIRLNTKYEVISTYVLQRKISGIQSLKDSYISYGTERYEHNINSSKNDVIKLKSKVNILNRNVEETVSKIEDVEKKVSTEIKQTAEGLTVEINKAQSIADDAAKYATNYLDLGSNGLVVGNIASEILGKNVLIGSDTVSIRDGDTILSDYSANKIRLGLNSASSIIELCGGMANMKYHSPNNYEYVFEISSDEPIALSSKNSAQLYSKIENDNETVLSGIIARVVPGLGATLTIESSHYTSDGNTSNQSSISLGNNLISIFGGSVGAYFNLNTDFLDIIGNVKATGGLYVGDNLHMWTDDEGGNIELRSPNDVLWQMDAHDNDLRLYTFGTDGVYRSPFSIGYSDGDVDFWQNIGVWGDLYAQKGFCLNGNWQTDTVVAQGDSGIWWYRKWASGFAECWCSKAVSATGNGYSMSALSAPVNTAFPFPFMSTPLLTYNSIGQSNVNHLVGNISYDQNMVYSVILHPAAANNATFSGNLIIHAFGKWK